MKLTTQSAILAALLVMGLANPSPVSADDKKDINKSQAAKKARQEVNGRVLKVDQKQNQYRVKMLKKSGRVVSVNVDKKSGKVIQPRKKNKDKQ